jgi:hypothetical protein
MSNISDDNNSEIMDQLLEDENLAKVSYFFIIF